MTDLTNNIIPVCRTAVALGFFDGLHLGHMKVVEECFRHKGLSPAMFTFHSDTALPKREKPENLLTNDMKLEKLEQAGIEYIYSPDFESVKHYTAQDFIEKILVRIMNAKVVVCGFDFRLGAGAGCDANGLKELCRGYGIEVVIIPPFSLDGCIVHSTAIKQLIKSGEIARANKLLGYEFSIEVKVIEGNRIGTTIGSPTINQIFPENIVMPRFGVYKGITMLDGKRMPSVTNIGVKPTVDYKDKPLAETHILGYSGDLYGRVLRISLLDFIRPERRFNSVSELKEQLDRDKAAAKQ